LGDILYTQTIQVTAAKNSSPVTEKDFEIFPAEVLTSTAYSESFSGRYNIPDLTVDAAQGMGSVALGKVFIITPTSNIQVKFTNGLGTTPELTFVGGRTSVLHMEYTNFVLTNTSGNAVKGRYYVLGD
jgi:hypothetical protein